MKHPDPLPPHLARRPFTLDESRAASIPRSRTRAPDLWTPSRGIRVPRGAEVDLVEQCRPYTEVTRQAVVSHITAARIHGFYLPFRCSEGRSLDLSCPPGVGQPRRKHVTGHRLILPPQEIIQVRGVPVTSIQRTLLDLAPLLTLDELVAAGDQIVCAHDAGYRKPKIAMVSLEVLNTYIAGHRGHRGLARLRGAMELVRVGVDSAQETRLRLIIVRSPLPVFEPNIRIQDAGGKPLIGPDLACEEYKTCLEYDGGHHTTSEQLDKDHDRDFITASLGWHQVIINKMDMRQGAPVVVTKIARMLVRGGWPDPLELARRSLHGALGIRRDFE